MIAAGIQKERALPMADHVSQSVKVGTSALCAPRWIASGRAGRVCRFLYAVSLFTLMTGCSGAVVNPIRPDVRVSATERAALLRRAQLWSPVNVAAVDLRSGAVDGTLAPGTTLTCEYVDRKFGGHTPKFGCTTDGDHVLKVRYGRDNGEVYAGVAATRLLWALGFSADALSPVHVLCRHCPAALASEGIRTVDGIQFDIAAVERTVPGTDVVARGSGFGWAWPELALVDPAAGGAPAAHRDALTLLAVLLQHSDNKPDQQRLICRTPTHSSHELAACVDPWLAIHDLGQTFGRANTFNRSGLGSVNLDLWSTTPIWKDRAHCVGNLAPSRTGTLSYPQISEPGRRFLADLLAQLSDEQLRDLFSVARFADKPHGGGPVDAWVAAFKHKRDEIASASCPYRD
jgi:hypothetical protein